jgi:hypothetical protein
VRMYVYYGNVSKKIIRNSGTPHLSKNRGSPCDPVLCTEYPLLTEVTDVIEKLIVGQMVQKLP